VTGFHRPRQTPTTGACIRNPQHIQAGFGERKIRGY
jgi:hypothetical protein